MVAKGNGCPEHGIPLLKIRRDIGQLGKGTKAGRKSEQLAKQADALRNKGAKVNVTKVKFCLHEKTVTQMIAKCVNSWRVRMPEFGTHVRR